MKWLAIIFLALAATVHAQWWAGTVIESSPPTQHSVTMATGTFVVPQPTEQSADVTVCNIWVGLGGYWDWDRTLQQIGIELNTWHQQPVIRVWYEFWPASYHYIKLNVAVGDTITLAAKYETDEDCQLSIVNHTQGTGYGITKRVNKPDQGSGEWMIEDDLDYPLTRFPWLIWTDCQATVNGVETGIDSGVIEQWSQIDSLMVLDGTEDSFAVAQP